MNTQHFAPQTSFTSFLPKKHDNDDDLKLASSHALPYFTWHNLTFFCYFTGYENNFQIYTHAQIDLLEAPYDMTSLMHMPRYAFSKNGFNTLEARAGAHVILGPSSGLTAIDKAQLNMLYRCTGYPSKY